MKTKRWCSIVLDLNSKFSTTRSHQNVKDKWAAMKKQAKKSSAAERRETMSTGGGTIDRTKIPTQLDTSVLDILGDSIKPITNFYDSDRSVDLVDKPEEDIPQKKLKRSTSQVIDVKSSPKNRNLTSHDYIELKMNLARELQEEKLRMLREKHELEMKILLATAEKPSDNDSQANDKPSFD